MKHTLIVISLVSTTLLCSCKERFMPTAEQENRAADSIRARYSLTGNIMVKVNDEDNSMVITIADPTLYASPAANKKSVADVAGAIALRVFGKDNLVDKGDVIFTRDKNNSTLKPIDGVVTEINTDSLKKGM